MQATAPIRFLAYGVRNKEGTNDTVSTGLKAAVHTKPVQIKVISHWCDQLQGPKTGKIMVKLCAPDGSVKEQVDVFDTFQRGEDLKYIHFVEFAADHPIVSKAEVNDTYETFTISGTHGSYKEDEEIEGEIPYEAEVRLFYYCMQVNHKKDDTMPPPESNVVLKKSETEQTDFVTLWPHIRDNLKTMGRIKDADVPVIYNGMW